MSRRKYSGLLAACGGLALATSACSSATDTSPGAAHATGSFPVSVTAVNGTVHIAARPHVIVSLSPTATEMLFAIGAGGQVKAVDKNSNYPRQAPHSALDGFQPNVEAIGAYRPDLVVVADDSAGLTGRLGALGIPVLSLPAATTLADVYHQLDELGVATGRTGAARAEATRVRSQISHIVATTSRSYAGKTYYYELDPTYFSVTSSTFVGHLLGLLGLRNIADDASGAASSGGYPQLSSEFIVHADPDYVFLADTICCGQSGSSVAARPGWSTVRAVVDGHVVALNDDVASRWGPRVVDLLRTVATSLPRHAKAA
jgi:iron complex transport system substrate-binding protein